MVITSSQQARAALALAAPRAAKPWVGCRHEGRRRRSGGTA
jgi:hypothetical protein